MSTTTRATGTTIKAFAELGAGDVAFAGGKGASLGELARAGLPVPDGFVIGAPAYARFRAGALADRLERILATVDDGDVGDVGELGVAAATAREAVLGTTLPVDVEAEIRAAYAELGGEDDGPVAVRSSATSEAASIAGVNETFLNVRGAADVIAAVKGCWAALFAARAISYRARNGLGTTDMDLAVVVQRQVDATRAGVMYTVEPSREARRRVVIEAAFGLGEPMVAGRVSPDRYVLDEQSLALLRREVHAKDELAEALPEGGVRVHAAEGRDGLRRALADAEVVAIAEAGRRIEQHLGAALETEWALDAAGVLWFLQAGR